MHLVATSSTSTETEVRSKETTSSGSERRRRREEDVVKVEAETESEYLPTMSQFWYNVIIVCLILIIVVLFAVILSAMYSGKAGGVGMDHVDICETRQCLELAAKIKSYQNQSVEACDDFFEHACGRYHEHQSFDQSALLEQQNVLQSLIFATVRKTAKFASKPAENLRIFAKKCIDERAMDGDSFEELSRDIEQRGGFPFIDSHWDEASFNLSEMLANYIQINRNRLGFLAVEPYTVRTNGELLENRLFVSPGPHWSWKREMPMTSFRNGIAFMIRRLLKIRNETLNDEKFDVEFQKMVELEANFSELANFRYTPDARGNISNIRPLSDLEKSIPEVDWKRILRAIPAASSKPEDVEVLLEKVDVMSGDYFFGAQRKLARLATETAPQALANYLVFRQLIDVSLHFYNQDQAGKSKFWGHADRKSFCGQQLVEFFPMPAMNVLREQTGLKTANLEEARQIFEELKTVYREMLRESTVLPEKALREAAIRKLDAITANFGFPEYFEGEPLLEEMYRTLNLLETDTPWQVYMKMWRHRTEQIGEHIVKNTRLNPVQMRIGSLNAVYRAYENHLNVHLPLLTYPCMDPDFPKYAVYACIGVILGHEIGHAFDNFHRFLDENGRPQNWWARFRASNSAYETTEQCLIDQYSRYKEPGFEHLSVLFPVPSPNFQPDRSFQMNGTHPRLELFADHFGVQTAFRALQKVHKTDGYMLGGTNGYTREQMFFYRHATHYCDVLDPNRNPEMLIHQTHPVSRYRVNGNLQNMAEFAEAFQCPEGAPMNPKAKCKVF